ETEYFVAQADLDSLDRVPPEVQLPLEFRDEGEDALAALVGDEEVTALELGYFSGKIEQTGHATFGADRETFAQVELVSQTDVHAIHRVGDDVAVDRHVILASLAIEVHRDRPPLESLPQIDVSRAYQAVGPAPITFPNRQAAGNVILGKALDEI